MKIFLIILIVLVSLFAAAVAYFYRYAFVRKRGGVTDDLEAATNRFLKPYAEVIKPGYEFIENSPHSWVETTSFDGLRLAARYYPREGSKRTMLLFHGYRSSAKRDFSCAVKMYHEMGLNVLLCDQRSHGRSEGKIITFGVKERRDVLSWIDFVLRHYGEDTEIFLGGMSMGATTVLLSAGLGLPENVKGIVADCGFTSPEEIITKVAKQYFHIKGVIFIPIFDAICRVFGHFSIHNISTVDALSKSDIPVLFIHGRNDGFVPCEMSEMGYKAARGEKKILLVDGADHGFSFLIDTDGVTRTLGEFLSAH